MAVTKHEVGTADGTTIPVWVSGQGRPLLIIHGGTANHEAWEPVRPYLEEHVTVAIMDRRATLEDPFEPLDLDTEFQDIATVAESLGDEADLLGHSSGALCALGASRQASNLRKLIVYEPPMVAGVEPGPEQLAAGEKLWELLQSDDREGIYDTFVSDFAGPSIGDPEAWEDWRGAIAPYSRSVPREMAAIGECTSLAPEAFDGLQAPTLFLRGTLTPPQAPTLAYIEPLRQAIPDFTVRDLPNQEHLANFTAPELIADVVLEFLAADQPLDATS